MTMQILILGLGGPEVALIAVLALLMFGGKKIPELMNGVGKGVKSFRDGLAGNTTPAEGEQKSVTATEKKDDQAAQQQK